jgi:RNA polymerase sigma-70 factor (ECF subfamily)
MNPDDPTPAAPTESLPADAVAPTVDVDRLLIDKFLQGDNRAFEVLVVKYQRRIAAVIERLVRHAALTEDLTQETFIKAYRALPEFRGESLFSTWLHTIARNTAMTHLGSRQARVDRAASADSLSDPAELTDADSLQGTSPSPEDELASKQLLACIESGMADLPPAQRDALLLREIEGLSYAEIAERLKTPLNTVRTWIFRARVSVAAKMQPAMNPTRSRRW